MIRYIALLSLLLTACNPVVVKPKWPDVPSILTQPCTDLEEIDQSSDKLSDVLIVVTDNYSKYHECKIKLSSWVEWYNTQKEIYDSIK